MNKDFLIGIKKYIITTIIVLIFDFVWLLWLMQDFYTENLAGFARPNPVPIWSAIIAWALIPLGIVIFVDKISKNYKESIIYGGVYGLILYGLYGFTNYAILANWTSTMLVVDVFWGIFLCSTNSLILKAITKRIPKCFK
jgi:uncharacterized membrane protein